MLSGDLRTRLTSCAVDSTDSAPVAADAATEQLLAEQQLQLACVRSLTGAIATGG